ncbi:MAG: cadherin-like domain-containing protein, partial [Planctomycetota bacterium]
IRDASGNVSNTATVTLTVTPVDESPTAADDTATLLEGATVAIDLAGNDSDPEGALDPASIQIVTGPANGSVTVNADGTADYTHDGSETTSDSFTYTIRDASGNVSNTATVSLTIVPVGDAPIFVNNSLTLAEGEMVVLSDADLRASDADTSLASLDFSVVDVSGGRFERVGAPGVAITSFGQTELDSGQVLFVHDGGEQAPAYTLTVGDGALTSAASPASITFANVNDAPTLAANTGAVVSSPTQILGAGELRVDDPDDAPDAILYTLTSAPSSGRIELAGAPGVAVGAFSQADLDAGRAVYVRASGTATSDAFGFRVSDSAGSGPSGTFTLDLATATTILGPADIMSTVQETPSEDPQTPEDPAPEASTQEASPEEDRDPVDQAEEPQAAPESAEGGPELPFTDPDLHGERPIFGLPASFDRDVQGQQRPSLTEVADAVSVWTERKVYGESTEQDLRASRQVWRPESLDQALTQLRRELSQSEGRRQGPEEMTIQTVESVAIAISTGVIASILRSSSLWAAAASAMPLWRRVDPLVVLTVSNEEREKMLTELRSESKDEAGVRRVFEDGSERST